MFDCARTPISETLRQILLIETILNILILAVSANLIVIACENGTGILCYRPAAYTALTWVLSYSRFVLGLGFTNFYPTHIDI